jgi:hypothetical protein
MTCEIQYAEIEIQYAEITVAPVQRLIPPQLKCQREDLIYSARVRISWAVQIGYTMRTRQDVYCTVEALNYFGILLDRSFTGSQLSNS